jgi:hypothetical protein
MTDIAPELVKGRECKHAVYRDYKPKSNHYGEKNEDIVLVKEVIHGKDGSLTPNVRLFKNLKRPFHVAKPGFRKYNDKKEWERTERLDKRECTQVNLTAEIARAFGRPGVDRQLRYWGNSPYLYGADVTTPVILKNHYRKTWADTVSKNTVAALDIETDMVWGTKEIVSIAITFKDRAFIGWTKKFQGEQTTLEQDFRNAAEAMIGDELRARKTEIITYIGDNPGDICSEAIKYAHKWMPDIISIWNIDFDLPRVLEALEKDGYDIGDVFSDPCVPQKYRRAWYTKDKGIKVTQSGKQTPKHPADKWHTMDCLSSFYFLDSMGCYKKLRVAKGNEANYKLDTILKKVLNIRKLKIPGAGDDHNGKWHTYCQTHRKAEYLVYNLFDCISLEMLDEKTNDLAMNVSEICNISEYRNFPSIPRRTVDKLHFFVQEHGFTIGTTAENMEEELDTYVTSIQDKQAYLRELVRLTVPLLSNRYRKTFLTAGIPLRA